MIQLNQNLKAKDFELTAIQHDNTAQEKRIVLLMDQNKQLQERIQALEGTFALLSKFVTVCYFVNDVDESLINNKILNEVGILQFEKERLLFDLSAKDTQIASLREALSVCIH